MTTTFILINIAFSATIVGVLAAVMSHGARFGSRLELVEVPSRARVRGQGPTLRTDRRALIRDPQPT
jgi:hypothetical protein